MRTAFLAAFLVLAASCTGGTTSGGADAGPQPDTTSAAGSTSSPQVETPDVVDLTKADAKAAVEDADLIPGFKEHPVHDGAGVVLQQDPASGDKVDAGTTVTITVAVPYPRIPNVVGKSLEAAKTILRKAGYKPEATLHGTTANPNKRVFAQTPKAGTDALSGKVVTLDVWHNVCTPGYSPCLPFAPDYDCIGGSGDGPKYTGFVRVTGYDPYGLDADNDGYGCE